jgi:spermidine synthase
MSNEAMKIYVIAFVASFAAMVIEIAAGRMLSPYLGVSLYTWTSIIGTILAGISVGAWAGGRVADRYPRYSTLGWVLVTSGLAILSILPLVALFGSTYFSGNLLVRSLFVTAMIFFIPSFVLGMVCPIAVRLVLGDLNRAGTVAGKVFAVSTAGSITGTFATGFFLISLIGTRNLLLAVAMLLLALGSFILVREAKARLIALSLLLLLLWPLHRFVIRAGFSEETLLFKESDYYTIKVVKSSGENRLVTLYLDQLTHSCSDLDDPTDLVYRYTRSYAEILNWKINKDRPFKTLSIGGGGYTFPRYMEATYPRARIDVIEIDPTITSISRQYMGVSPVSRIRTFNGDARWFAMTHKDEGPYDFIFQDAFNDLSIPYHITTKEFVLELRGLLGPRGLLLTNVIDRFEKGSFLPAYIRTLEEVFGIGKVHLITLGPPEQSVGVENRVVIANLPEEEARELTASLNATIPERHVSYVMPHAQLRDYLVRFQPPLLTDDYVPVDNLAARNFR